MTISVGAAGVSAATSARDPLRGVGHAPRQRRDGLAGGEIQLLRSDIDADKHAGLLLRTDLWQTGAQLPVERRAPALWNRPSQTSTLSGGDAARREHPGLSNGRGVPGAGTGVWLLPDLTRGWGEGFWRQRCIRFRHYLPLSACRSERDSGRVEGQMHILLHVSSHRPE